MIARPFSPLLLLLLLLPLTAPSSPPTIFQIKPPFWATNLFTGEPQLQFTIHPSLPNLKKNCSTQLVPNSRIFLNVAAQNAEGLPFLATRLTQLFYGPQADPNDDPMFEDPCDCSLPLQTRSPIAALSHFRHALSFPMRNTTDYVYRIGLKRTGALVLTSKEIKKLSKKKR